MIIDGTKTKFERKDEVRPLEDYSEAEKIEWFDALYMEAEKYSKDDNAHNRKVYEALFINATADLVKRHKPIRFYEFIGIVIINDYGITKIEVTDEGE